MFCRKCGKENPNDAKFCASCGIDLHPTQPIAAAQPNMQQPQPPYVQSANGAAAVQQKSNNKTIIIVVAILAVLGVIAFFVCNNANTNNSDPMYGTWFVNYSQLTDQITVRFTKDTIIYGAKAIGNPTPFTASYEKIDNNTLKVYIENKPFTYHYELKDNNFNLTCIETSSLNLKLSRLNTKVPANNW